MKRLSFAATAAFLVATAAPLGAQQLTAKSYDFIHAVEQRNGDKATEILNDNPPGIVNSRNSDGDTALIIAISRQDPDWTGFLLKKGADVNLGAKVNGANRMGETPLIIAVQQRQPRIVTMLLNAGADPDKADSAAGYSARDYAARDNRGRQILQLIEAKKPKAPSGH